MVSAKSFLVSIMVLGTSLAPMVSALPRQADSSLDAPEKDHKAINAPAYESAIVIESGILSESEGLDKRWSDAHGVLPDGQFSVVFGGNGTHFEPFKDKVRISFDDWYITYDINCKGGGDWISLTSPLPWTVDIHKGNACHWWFDTGMWYDDTWIKYSGEFLNTPTDTRCGRVGFANLGMRCLITA